MMCVCFLGSGKVLPVMRRCEEGGSIVSLHLHHRYLSTVSIGQTYKSTTSSSPFKTHRHFPLHLTGEYSLRYFTVGCCSHQSSRWQPLSTFPDDRRGGGGPDLTGGSGLRLPRRKTPNGPLVTSPRIKLGDGRHLAYRERGVPKDKVSFRVILVHGFDSSKDLYIPLSQEFMEELGLYLLTFDRARYGESDPHPKRTVKSEAFDIQELADTLKLGNRLAEVSLLVPVTNFWWPSFPAELAQEAFKKQLKRDQWKLWIAAPIFFNRRDIATIQAMSKFPNPQEGNHESLHRDMILHFGTWEFDPMELNNPFPNRKGSVHLWQGNADKLVSLELQRYVAKNLPWIKYHWKEDGSHLMIHEDRLCEAMFRELCLG